MFPLSQNLLDKRSETARFSVDCFWSRISGAKSRGTLRRLGKNWRSKKFMSKNGGYALSRISVENFFVSLYSTFHRATFLFFRKFPQSEKFMHKRRRVPRFFVHEFSSHSTETFRCGTLRFSRKIGVWKKPIDNTRGDT